MQNLLINGTSLRRESITSVLSHFLLIQRQNLKVKQTEASLKAMLMPDWLLHAKLLAQRLCITGFDCQYSYIVVFPFYLPFPCTASLLYQAFKKPFLLLLPEIFKIVTTLCR